MSVKGLCQFSQMPTTPKGSPSRREIAYRHALEFFRKKLFIHAASLPVGIARMDRREIRPLLAEMRDQPPDRSPSTGSPALGVPPVDKLRFVWPSLLIHAGLREEKAIPSPTDSDSFRSTIYCGRRYVLEFATCLYDQGTSPTGWRPRTARWVRAGNVFIAPRTGAGQGKGLPAIVSEGRLYERGRKVARAAGRRHRIHRATAQDRGLMAAEDDKLESFLNGPSKSVRRARYSVSRPLRTTTSAGPAARSPSSLRTPRTRPGRLRPYMTPSDAIGGIPILPLATA
jgi:hypothetical protein